MSSDKSINNAIRKSEKYLILSKYRHIWKRDSFHPQFDRIYFYHVRKASGTSLNFMFLALGGERGEEVYTRLLESRNHIQISGPRVYVGWDKYLIEKGVYFFAFSHLPAHRLRLPTQTFTVTCLRDPVQRILSHYRMLLEYKLNKVPHPCMKVEGKWLGDGIDAFIRNVPDEHLLNQVFMFSKSIDPVEALDRIMSCDHVIFTEDFANGVEKLGDKLHLGLKPIHTRKTDITVDIKEHHLDALQERLKPEVDMYNTLRKNLATGY